jgi:hypothetical protein
MKYLTVKLALFGFLVIVLCKSEFGAGANIKQANSNRKF